MKKWRDVPLNVFQKVNRILNGILIVLILIAIRVWHLAVIQHEEKIEEARKPQERVVIDRAERATICDRFNIPLAINKVQYNAAICYGPIRELPRWIWRKDIDNKRVKYYYRKQYITRLSERLGSLLHLDPERIEDLIHSKAAILGNVPCIIKENISEEEYFRLRMLEKDWPGIQAEIAAKRCYPLGPVGAEVVGYIGSISREEYHTITDELRELRHCFSLWEEGENPELPKKYPTIEVVASRLEELEKKAYTVNDLVGKVGVEAVFDETLRGVRGKQLYLADPRGNFLRRLPGSENPSAGHQLVLTLSSELQAYAEQLLVEYEQQLPSLRPAAVKKRSLLPDQQPWIKGGSIVVMDPRSAEILALASFPRFDPNDFIRSGQSDEVREKNRRIHQWLETETHLAHIWNLKTPLQRERFDPIKGVYYQESIELSWESYLNLILPKNSPVKQTLELYGMVGDAIKIQNLVEQLISIFEMDAAKVFDCIYSEEDDVASGALITLQERAFFNERIEIVREQVEFLKEQLSPYFYNLPLNYEKLLLVDLYRLTVDPDSFAPFMSQISEIEKISISDHQEISSRFVSVEEAICEIVKDLFCAHHFKQWRDTFFKDHLAKKRREEKAAKRKYARPFIEYLDQAQKEQFEVFWDQYRLVFLSVFLTGAAHLDDPEIEPYLTALSQWVKELKKGAHQGLDWVVHYHRLSEMIDSFDPNCLLAYTKTFRRFETLNRPLYGRYSGLRGKEEKALAGAFYPSYGFGYCRSHAFRQATTIGSIFKIVPAYEALRQRYLQLEAEGEGRGSLNPLTIIDNKHRTHKGWNVGFTLDGQVIPHYYRGGRLPRSEHAEVGRVDLVRALETSSNPYFSMLAGEVMEDPEDLCRAAILFGFGGKTGLQLPGEYGGRIPNDVAYNRTGLYAMAIGQHTLVSTPLQASVMLAALANGGKILQPLLLKREPAPNEGIESAQEVRWRVFLPPQLQNMLLTGLRRVVLGEKGTARFIRGQFPDKLIRQVIGKTSTGEMVEKMSLDGSSGHLKIKHIGFGAIAYETEDFSKPELVVVVYLRHGEFGRDAVPFAFKIIEKWREIQTKHLLSKN
ncbi:MAG: penicillin-binding transpeptidase domain-containing protein [Chlamydiales bacterium]